MEPEPQTQNQIPPQQPGQTQTPTLIEAKVAASELRKGCNREKVAFISCMIASFVCSIASVFNVWAATITALFFSIYALIFYIKANNLEKYLTNKYHLEKISLLPKIKLEE